MLNNVGEGRQPCFMSILMLILSFLLPILIFIDTLNYLITISYKMKVVSLLSFGIPTFSILSQSVN
jgi:hypothetical protein